jgi:hypothetical protein
MATSRKTARHPESENDLRDTERPEARKEAASELLSPAMPPIGAGADPRLDQTSETEAALGRAAEPSDTNEPAEANQRRKSGNTDTAGA